MATSTSEATNEAMQHLYSEKSQLQDGELGLNNGAIIVANVSTFKMEGSYDQILSIEMSKPWNIYLPVIEYSMSMMVQITTTTTRFKDAGLSRSKPNVKVNMLIIKPAAHSEPFGAGLFGTELQKVVVVKRGLGLLIVFANITVPTFGMARLEAQEPKKQLKDRVMQGTSTEIKQVQEEVTSNTRQYQIFKEIKRLEAQGGKVQHIESKAIIKEGVLGVGRCGQLMREALKGANDVGPDWEPHVLRILEHKEINKTKEWTCSWNLRNKDDRIPPFNVVVPQYHMHIKCLANLKHQFSGTDTLSQHEKLDASMGNTDAPVEYSILYAEKEIGDLLPVEVKEQRVSNSLQSCMVGGLGIKKLLEKLAKTAHVGNLLSSREVQQGTSSDQADKFRYIKPLIGKQRPKELRKRRANCESRSKFKMVG
uniref:Uncharacterized protein n=1 Tax=Tanacetum cinerariifolium TaxID=118510 RepID=A0A699H3P9_TANCI|nr:hypothetical protein [Tanacetum cinerariifolium]